MRIIAIPSKAGSMKNNRPDLGPDAIIKKLDDILLTERGKNKDFVVERVEEGENQGETNKRIKEHISKTRGFFYFHRPYSQTCCNHAFL